MNLKRYILRWLRYMRVTYLLMLNETDYNGARDILSEPFEQDDATTDSDDRYLLYFDYDTAKRVILEEELYWISGMFDKVLRFLSKLHKAVKP